MADDVIARAIEMMENEWGIGDHVTEESYSSFAHKLADAGLLAVPQQPIQDLAARLAAADTGWCTKHGVPPSNPDYIWWLANQVDAFEPHASGHFVRCPSCEHRMSFHTFEGCVQEIAHGPNDEPDVCSCAVTDAAGIYGGATDESAARPMRTFHVTTTRDIPDGHTDQRVRYDYHGDSWEGWLIGTGPGDVGEETYIMRDNGERWVVMSDNVTRVDSAAALAALKGEQHG